MQVRDQGFTCMISSITLMHMLQKVG